MKNRYGPRYTKALLVTTFIAFFLPIPGISLLAIAVVVAVAEVHQGLASYFKDSARKELVMSIHCEVILKWKVTQEQLRALGTTLWRWGIPAAGTTGMYPFLDNQTFADLIAGKFPALEQTNGGEPHFWLQDMESPDRQTTIDNLRRLIPAEGVADIVVDGQSWNSFSDGLPDISAAESTVQERHSGM